MATLAATITAISVDRKRLFAADEEPRTCSSCGVKQLPESHQFQQRRKSKKANGGALHLIVFDTSPLKVHTQQTSRLLRLLARTQEIAACRLHSKLRVCAAHVDWEAVKE